MDEFKGKTVFISGAGSGIGQAAAQAFAEAGASLILTGRDLKKLETVKSQLSAKAQNIDTVELDLTDEKKAASFFRQLGSLDIAVNNAGLEGRIAEITDLTLRDFDDLMAINARAVFQSVQEQVRYFRSNSRPGVIVNVASVAGLIGIPTSSLYCMSKHAVIGLTKTVAVEQIPFGIRVNAVCPGGVDTPMLARVFPNGIENAIPSHPIGRLATPKEVADAIIWLSSDSSRFIVGHGLVVDGGRTAW